MRKVEKKKKSGTSYRILLIEDGGADQVALSPLVREESAPYDYALAGSISEAKKILKAKRFDVVITDYRLGDGTVFDIFETLTDTPVIIVTGSGNEEVAVKAMKAGAYDYIVRDHKLNYLKVLPLTIENAIKRKKAEERLQLLESAVTSANDAIIILEAEPGEQRGRSILYVNEAFTKMTGYTFEEATDKTLRMLRGPETSLTTLNKIRIALERHKAVRVELVNYRKDGSKFWVECNIVPFADEHGSFIHWVSVQRDITERKTAEEEREWLMKKIECINADLTELNQELETIGAERTMSLMALTVADRIRNPASMIGGRCRRILNKEVISDNLRQGLQYIMEGAEKLDRIVSDFEMLLKEKQYKFKNDDFNRIVEKVVPVIKKEAACKGIKMEVSISNDALRINMQQDLLRVAVFHVIKNAVEASTEGGTIMVKTYRDGDTIALSVSDSGYGIPQEDVENVFKPFFSTKERGFGMGLPLVRQIVSEHLGTLIIESKPGNGSTFKLEFPVRWIDEKLNGD
jgi:PAS domain S-box-containing protein